MNSDTINRAFTKVFNEILEAYNAAHKDDEVELNQCISRARTLLKEPAIPRFHRIKTLLLLSRLVGDTQKAEKYLDQAYILFRVVRNYEEYGNPDVDGPLAELEESIKEMRGILAKEIDAKIGDVEEATQVEDEVGAESDGEEDRTGATVEERAEREIAVMRSKMAEATKQQAEELRADAVATGYGTDDVGLKQVADLTRSKAAPLVKPETATDEQMQQMTHDWQNVVHESLEEVQVQREPAVVDKLKQLGDALSRANFAAYNQHRVALNQIVKEILERRRLQEIRKRAAAPPHKSTPG